MKEVSLTVWAVIVGYFIIVIAIGLLAGRGQKNMTDYYVSGRSMTSLLVALSVTATTTSGFTFVGLPGLTYSTGYGPFIGIVVLGGVPGIILSFYFLAKPMRRLSEEYGLLTVPDFAAALHGNSQTLRLFSAIAIIIATLCYLIVQWVSVGVLFQSLLGSTYIIGVIVGTLVVAAYLVFGGQTSNIYNDTFQMIIMGVGGFAAIVIGIKLVGGLTAMHNTIASVKPMMLQPWGPGVLPWWQILSFFILYCIGFLGQPQITTRFYTINKVTSFRSAMLMALLAYVFTSLMYFIGPILKALEIQGKIAPLATPDLATPTFLSNFVPPILGGIILAAALAAIMSTAAALILNVSAAIVRDVLQQGMKVNFTGQQGLRYGRVFVAVMILLSMFLSFNPPSIIAWIGNTAWGMFAAALTPIMIFSWWWRRATKYGAIASVAVGSVLSVVLYILKITKVYTMKFDTGAFALICALVVYVVVSYLTPAEDKTVLDKLWGKKVKLETDLKVGGVLK